MTNRVLLVAALCLSFTTVSAESAFKSGQHYEAVTPAQPTRTGEKIEVVELFWYGCRHCYAFEPHIKKWLEEKADYIKFVRVPAVFSPKWEVHARAFYAAEQLDVTDRIHIALFEAIHVDKRRITTEDALAAFFVERGIDEVDFRTAYHSFDVDGKTGQAKAATRKYGITSVPSMVIAGKYRSSARDSGSLQNLLKLVDHLADKENNL